MHENMRAGKQGQEWSARVTAPELFIDGTGFLSNHIPGVCRGLSLEQQDVTLLFRDRIVPYTFRNNEHLTLSKVHGRVFHFDAQVSFQDEKQLVLPVVTVPCEGSFDLRHLDIGIVDFAYDPWGPVIGQSRSNFFEHDYARHIFAFGSKLEIGSRSPRKSNLPRLMRPEQSSLHSKRAVWLER